MSSKELSRLTDVASCTTKNLACHFGVQAIFNRHATVDDAITSASEVKDRSIVFIEGFRADHKTGQDSISSLINGVSYAHLKGQIDDTQARNYRSQLALEVDEALSDAKEEGVFEWQLYKSLLEKKCDIIHADYSGHASFDLDDEGQKFIRTTGELAGGPVNRYIVSGEIKKQKGIYRHANELFRAYMRLSAFQHMRENFAIFYMTRAMQSAIENQMAPHVARTESGLISTSVIYGTSHKNSLTKKLAAAGFNTDSTVLGDVHEADCIEGELYAHKSWRVGYEILKAVNLYGCTGRDKNSTTKDKLQAYAVMIAPRPEEKWDALARGIRSLHDISHDRHEGYDEAERLISNVIDRVEAATPSI